MALEDIKGALGIDRVIWIDDVFGEPTVDLAIIARQHPQIQSEFHELQNAFAVDGYGDVDEALQSVINEFDEARRTALRMKLLQYDAEADPGREISDTQRDAVCALLNISVEDRWAFEKADSEFANWAADDSTTAYMIDLKEGGVSDQRGLEILIQMRRVGSKGVAFILTHEATIVTEAALEVSLEAVIPESGGLAPGLTVISKDRLDLEDGKIEAELSVAFKRAGLRRTLHIVLSAASDQATEAYKSTAASLLNLEPERLEQYVYDRGRTEGVSELHVVERALSAGASKQLRTFFGCDPVVHQAVQSLRALQAVTLDANTFDAGPILSGFRDAEIWDDAETINGSLSPLANGDIFCFDDSDPESPKKKKRFVLLGQPCDLMLRANGTRDCEIAMLVPVIVHSEDGVKLPDANDPDEPNQDGKVKAPTLPFRLNGKGFRLDIRNMAYVRLAILDLACFRKDGCIRVEAGHAADPAILTGAHAIYGERTAAAGSSLEGPVPDAAVAGVYTPIDDRLMLTMSDGDLWRGVRLGKRLAAFNVNGHHLGPLPDRVTWFLRRDGRIRAPYSAFLLERALHTLGRRAFDADYTA